MALVHRAKLTHYFSPSSQHLGSFYRALARLYGEQRHCDLKLVVGGGGHEGRLDVDDDDDEDEEEEEGVEEGETMNDGEEGGEEGDGKAPPAAKRRRRRRHRSLELRAPPPQVVFGTHQVVFAGCSAFVRELLQKTTEGCLCEAVTLYLPDFSPDAVKNLLSMLYTGTSIGDCSPTELKSLLDTLKIDLSDLSVKPLSSGSRGFPEVETPNVLDESNADVIALSEAVLERRRRAAVVEADGGTGADADAEITAAADDASDNEMMQIAPEVQMFLGNHFLADSDERSQQSGGGGGAGSPNKHAGDGTNGATDQKLARHKDLFHRGLENGSPSMEGREAKANGTMKLLSHQMGMAAAAAAAAAHHGLLLGGEGGAMGQPPPPELDSRYSCRLCGKVSGNGASLFAHLLYPHYAHLWRDDVPHRAPRYDCKECSYSTVKRQHFVMHVARVHDELRKKLAALGENLEVLDNLTQKSQTSSNERIVSKIAKGVDDAEAASAFANLQQGRNSPSVAALASGSSSPSAKDFFNAMSSDDKSAASSSFPSPGGLMAAFDPMRHQMPRGAGAFKPFVKCRLCGKSWKGKDNFFTHLVSTHFKYLWAKEVPRSADMYHCHVPGCSYQSKYRYNFLFHLAGKHKQLKQKLAEEGIPENVLVPIEGDASDFTDEAAAAAAAAAAAGGGFPGEQAMHLASAMAASGGGGSPEDLMRHSKMLMQQQKSRMMTTPPSALKGGGGGGGRPSSSSQNNTRLICRVCSKVSLNHTCHRQHVVGKHFYEFWAHLSADGMGIFNCHHRDCTYKTPNRSVFIIHLAYVHQELKNKLIASGKDPNCATPDVYGKRKYRRQYYDNTQHRVPVFPDLGASSSSAMAAAAAAAAAAQRDMSSLVSQQQAEVIKQLASQFGGGQFGHLMGNGFPQMDGSPTANEGGGSGNDFEMASIGGDVGAAADAESAAESSATPEMQQQQEQQQQQQQSLGQPNLPPSVEDGAYDDDLEEDEDDVEEEEVAAVGEGQGEDEMAPPSSSVGAMHHHHPGMMAQPPALPLPPPPPVTHYGMP